ncbi:hypothetical protein LPJ73_000525 [Coemansia sp. RSA 2703]|nr:hypothetical protein LPJ73_000525 [Coemansia sp. RSA 2703]
MAATGESINSRRASSKRSETKGNRIVALSRNNQHKQESEDFHQTSSSLRSTLSSKSHTTRHTAFYTATTNPTPDTESFHTALDFNNNNDNEGESRQMARNDEEYFRQQQELHEQSVDMSMLNAVARQYVVDAETAGSASPSHMSRRNTASRDNSDIPEGEEPPVPRLPPLAHTVYPDEKHPVSAVHSVESSELTSEPANEPNNLRISTDDEDDANEARFFVPAHMRYPSPKYVYAADSSIPMGAVLFALGFLLLPLWWVGAVFPRGAQTDVVRTWRKYNALMTLLSLPLLGLFLGLGGWQAVHG